MSEKFSFWFKATDSSAGDNCVEVSFADNGDVGVRDSKNPNGAILEYTADEWAAFTAGVRKGEFDAKRT
jgi:hypothetical protein